MPDVCLWVRRLSQTTIQPHSHKQYHNSLCRIHVRGNGTCQLSSKKIYATKTRPVGTIFDPDFDMYARNENCLPGGGSGTSQQPPFPGGLENSNQPPSSTFPSGGDRPGSQPPNFGTNEPGDPTTVMMEGGDDKTTYPTTYHPSSSINTRYPDFTVTERYPGDFPSTVEYGNYPSNRDPYNRYPEGNGFSYGRPTSPSSSGYEGGYYEQQPGKRVFGFYKKNYLIFKASSRI